ncbi:YceI family protein [Ekhidna sp. To15]|uniref:YceI family protein n=1 Tax=Ekhidna sp. To15 TaxID=3395267 RepID=UPI003F524ADD
MKYLLIIGVLTGFFSAGQINLNAEKSSMRITGTSSLHDWEMTVDEFDVQGVMTDTEVQNLEVTIIAKSMKSGKSIMDGKAYDAVQADDYPKIKFTSESLQIMDDRIYGQGTLEIGGESRMIELDAEITKKDNEMQLQGQVPLKMTDFKIQPPTAMFGTLKTGDEVIIHYDIFLDK